MHGSDMVEYDLDFFFKFELNRVQIYLDQFRKVEQKLVASITNDVHFRLFIKVFFKEQPGTCVDVISY